MLIISKAILSRWLFLCALRMPYIYRVKVPNEPVNGNRKLNARVLRATSNLKEASGKTVTDTSASTSREINK